MATFRSQDRRSFLVAALFVLGRVGLFVSAIFAAVLISTSQPFPGRVWLIGGLSLATTFVAALLLRAPSVISQVVLEATGIAGLSVGLSLLFRASRSGLEGLLSQTGAVGASLLVSGIASAFALRRLQAGKPSAI